MKKIVNSVGFGDKLCLFLVIYDSETILKDFSHGGCFNCAGSFSSSNSNLVSSVLKACYARMLCSLVLNHTKPKLNSFKIWPP